MFIIDNNTISNEKILNLGAKRAADIAFQFDGVQFADTDVFTLTIAGHTSTAYSFKVDAGLLWFSNFNFDWISATAETASISCTKNGDTILSDTIIITASNVIPELPAGQAITPVSSLAIAPEEGIIYAKTLAANDAVTFNTSALTSNTAVNFELHLTQNTSAVSFTFPNDILWYENGNFASGNAAPDMSDSSTKYALVFRWDGVKILGNLAYTENI